MPSYIVYAYAQQRYNTIENRENLRPDDERGIQQRILYIEQSIPNRGYEMPLQLGSFNYRLVEATDSKEALKRALRDGLEYKLKVSCLKKFHKKIRSLEAGQMPRPRISG